ncbi:hypothetical protein FOA43_001927 [Brettanomyces nanus]|uniref:Uncharacterized protein n=1 Tax=Eeniella nana TaxID=13502 RepID=A0A875RZK2_EENNA|nr:uncharacterized protein FOA43_001927 [Brettanomyces nanus]QPG74596.1 hypothetical protein FOA43_001927 [Brettanomyces nanus]
MPLGIIKYLLSFRPKYFDFSTLIELCKVCYYFFSVALLIGSVAGMLNALMFYQIHKLLQFNGLSIKVPYVNVNIGTGTVQTPDLLTEKMVDPSLRIKIMKPQIRFGVEPVEPVELVEPMEPMEPMELVELVEPVEPTGPVEQMEPVEPTGPVEQMEPVEPATPVKAKDKTVTPDTPFTPATSETPALESLLTSPKSTDSHSSG